VVRQTKQMVCRCNGPVNDLADSIQGTRPMLSATR
jgi:hypothetical protein